MAEMEVEVDGHLGAGQQVDEDLINYDSDVPDNFASHKIQNQDSPELESLPVPPADSIGDVEPYTNGDSAQYELQEEGGVDEVTIEAPGQDENIKSEEVDLKNNANGQPQGSQDAGDVLQDELHYDEDEQDQLNTGFEESDITASGDTGNSAEAEDVKEEQEISWEQDDHDGDDVLGGDDDVAAQDTLQYTHEDAEEGSDAKGEDTHYDEADATLGMAPVADETGVPADVPHAASEQDIPFTNPDNEVSQHDELTSHPIFPAITVHYKGDEFPCFSLSSEGFFSDVAVLESSIKSMLEGFRAELANELLPNEDLVFQVDELGLEFAEVCSRTSTETTQILLTISSHHPRMSSLAPL